ncbi:MAG: hypothetical protein U1E76_21200 [Planctomycetota bacterium]
MTPLLGPLTRRFAALFIVMLPQCSPAENAATSDAGQASQADSSSEPEEALQKPAAGDRDGAVAAVRKAFAAMQAGRLEEAAQLATAAVDLDPALVDARVLRSQILSMPGKQFNPLVGLRDVRIAALVEPENPAVVAAQGLLRYQLGQTERARGFLEAFLAMPPPPGSEQSRAQAHESLGVIDLDARHLDEADRHFAAAQALANVRSSAYYRSRVAAERGDLEGEMRWLDESLKLDPHYLPARNKRALLLAKLGRSAEASVERELQEVLRKLADDVSASFANDHAGKAALWGRVAELLPRDGLSRVNRLHELYLASDYEKVLDEGEQIVAQGGGVPRVLGDIARAAAQLGNQDKAVATLQQLGSAQPAARPEAIAAIRKEVDEILASKKRGGNP